MNSEPKDLKSELKENFSRLSELNRQLKDQVTIEGSVRDLISQQERHLAEYGRALSGLEELINMKNETLKSASDLELQLQEIKDQLKKETADKQKAEAELLKAQENIQKTLREFAAVTKRAERLNSQVNDLSSRLHVTEEEKMNIEEEVIRLQQQLEEVTAALETLKQQMEKRTAFFSSKVKELLGKLSESKLEKENKENELLGVQYALCEVEDENNALQSDIQDKIEQLRKSKANTETELQQANEKVQQMSDTSNEQRLHAEGLEAQLTEVHKQLEQRSGEKAELENKLRDTSEELEKMQEETKERTKQLLALEEELKRRKDNERLLETQLNQAKCDADAQKLLLRQRSEEMQLINAEKEELQRQLAEDEECSKRAPEIGMILSKFSM